MKNKILRGVFALVLLGIVANVTYWAVTNTNDDKPKTEEKVEITSDSSEDKEEVATSKFTKEGALLSATEMLRELQKSPVDGMTLEDRMKEVSNNSEYDPKTIFTDKGWEYIHLSDFMASDPRGKTLAAQSLLSVIHSIELVDNKGIEPANIDIEGVVYLDKKLRTTFVPLDLYTNSPTNLSFEMGYIDGAWVLQPYTLITQIAIRTMDDSVIVDTPEAKGSVSSSDDDESDNDKSVSNENKENDKDDK